MPADFKNALTESRMRYCRWVFLAAAAWNAFPAGAVLFLFTNAMFRMCALAPEFKTHRSRVESGYGRTAVALLRDPQHFATRKGN